jgi:hypothetical protein
MLGTRDDVTTGGEYNTAARARQPASVFLSYLPAYHTWSRGGKRGRWCLPPNLKEAAQFHLYVHIHKNRTPIVGEVHTAAAGSCKFKGGDWCKYKEDADPD